MPSIPDVVARLVTAGAPVLFLDTCSILDVIRAPVRPLKNCVEAAIELLELACESPVRCSIVIGSFVPKEWNSHASRVLDELERHLERMESQATHFHDLCGHLGVSVSFGRPGYRGSGLSQRLYDLSQQFLGTAITLDRHPDTEQRAYDRVAINPRRPCHKGAELKDCTIFEECLEVCRQLQSSGFTSKKVYCTSNTNDYCGPHATPHPDIDADCSSVDLIFATTLNWALSVVKTP